MSGSHDLLQGDVRSGGDVEGAVAGVDCVYHLASFGMSGRDQVGGLVTPLFQAMFRLHLVKAGRRSTKIKSS